MEPTLFAAGTRIGPYLILEKLGEGGMSEVFKAIEPTLERYVAIKIMHRTSMSDPEVMANFLEEARAVANLRHANIVPLYSAGEEQEVPYLAMGYIEGQTLEDWLLSGRVFNLADAEWFLRQAVAALEYAARLNIIHLDVKPANFMVDPDRVLMLTDFGLARKMTEVSSGMRTDDLQGTPAYASPEHILQEKPDLRTDIYCLGASLFHLLTGEFPFPGTTTEEVCRAHVFSPFPLETLQRHKIHSGWSSLIRKMMEKSPEERFQTYKEITAALNDIDHFHYGRKVLAMTETGDRCALPRTESAPEMLFDLLTPDLAQQGEHLSKIEDEISGDDVLALLDSRWSTLQLNAMAPDLRALQGKSSDDMRSLTEAMTLIPSYKETIESLSAFMATASGAQPQTDAERLELLGIERSSNLALTAMALYRPWQGEPLLNWHGLWQHQMYTGLLAEFMVDMLGLPASGLEYVCGLTHDIGKLVFYELYPEKTLGLWLRALEKNVPLAQLERQAFGIDHGQIGHEWLLRHKFHRTIRYAVAYHENPENCLDALAQTGKKGLIGSLISSEKPAEINILTHVVACANILAKELGLGYSGNPWLERAPWIEQPVTQLVYESRAREELTLEDFENFFMNTCRGLPDLSLMQLAYAEEGTRRRMELQRKEKKTKAAEAVAAKKAAG